MMRRMEEDEGRRGRNRGGGDAAAEVGVGGVPVMIARDVGQTAIELESGGCWTGEHQNKTTCLGRRGREILDHSGIGEQR